jgi:ribosomal-protein-serine acetyltransferase
MQQQDAQTGMVLGIFHGTSIIGEIGMQHWDHAVKKAQLGYWMSQAWQGKGILHRSLVNFLDFLFEKVGLNKVEIHYIAANERSACVASRLGCQVEGVLRQSFLRHGKLEDLVVTGILRAEWQR